MRRASLTWTLPASVLLLAGPASVLAQQSAVPPAAKSRTIGGDLSGIWGMAGDHYRKVDRSAYPESEWTTQKLPFTPKGREVFLATKPLGGPRQVRSQLSNDPRDEANPGGLYRTLIYAQGDRTFQLLQTPEQVVQLFSWGLAWRVIHTDGRPVPDDVAAGPFWYGYSVGHWDGDALVVTTLALDGRAWFDPWGTPISDEARIEERWRRIAPDQLQLTLTVTDPTYYTRPWTTDPVVYALQPKSEPQEIIFAPVDMQHFSQTLLQPSITPAPVK